MSKLDLRLIPVTPFQQNCSLLWDTQTMEGVLVDPGGEAEKIMKAAKSLEVTLKEIWLTHGHLDHAGGAQDIRDSDRYLEDGQTLSLGSVEFGVAHTPGHTPGHVVIYNQEIKIAFVGDVLFRGSIGRTDFPKGNHQQLLDSITTKLWPLGGDMRFVPGHGPMSTFGVERADNPFVGDAVIGSTPSNTSGVM